MDNYSSLSVFNVFYKLFKHEIQYRSNTRVNKNPDDFFYSNTFLHLNQISLQYLHV